MTDQPTLRDMFDKLTADNADLQRRLDNICLNIHTCSGDDCERPVCVLRRELTTLRADRDAVIEEFEIIVGSRRKITIVKTPERGGNRWVFLPYLTTTLPQGDL